MGSQHVLPHGYGLYAQQQVQGHPLLTQGPLGGPLAQPQAPMLKNQPSSSQQQKGMSSMSGISFIRPTDFTKYCTVDYARKAKPENCNIVLYVWGYVAQILASKQGLISAMPENEQIGRLQHLLHILELCAMQSSATDFNSPAWLCAKNYSERVYQDLDTGATSWSNIRPKMHPTNMMQAMASHPKKVVPDKPPVLGAKVGDAAAAPGQVCPRWSGCDVDDKCQWEVENPGRSCNRTHFCSFCQKKFKQVRKHKDTDCRKKAEQSSSGPDLPTS